MLIELGIQDLHRIESPIFLPGIIFFPFFSLFLLSLIFLSLLVACFLILILAVCFCLISAANSSSLISVIQ